MNKKDACKFSCILLIVTNYKAFCLPQTIDSLAAAGAILADVWLDNISMPVADCLGDEFLDCVKDGMRITIKEDGVVVVE